MSRNFSPDAEKKAESEMWRWKKGGVETQEKICGKACSFCPFLFIMPLKSYASGGKNYGSGTLLVNKQSE